MIIIVFDIKVDISYFRVRLLKEKLDKVIKATAKFLSQK